MLYVRAGEGWRRILDASGTWLQVCAGADPPCPVRIRPQRRSTGAHGWPDLGLRMKPPPSIVRLQFDGKVYNAVGGCEVRYNRVPSCNPGWKLPKKIVGQGFAGSPVRAICFRR